LTGVCPVTCLKLPGFGTSPAAGRKKWKRGLF
jgi:hypothetical protein